MYRFARVGTFAPRFLAARFWRAIAGSVPARTAAVSALVAVALACPRASASHLQVGTAGDPGTSCRAIEAAGGSTGDGVYWLDAEGKFIHLTGLPSSYIFSLCLDRESRPSATNSRPESAAPGRSESAS